MVRGIPPGLEAVVHWYNKDAQYWVVAGANGSYTSPPMKPGTYTMKLYRGEFPVAQESVAVAAGGTAAAVKNLAAGGAVADATIATGPGLLWRVGVFDGSPLELKNGDKIERMHPADVRMAAWGGNYTVGKSAARDFPMALFAKAGGTASVSFELARRQVGEAVLRVGTTLSFKGGRPSVKIGSWSGKDPGAPVGFPQDDLLFNGKEKSKDRANVAVLRNRNSSTRAE